MRIALFTDTFLPSVNGVTTSVLNFAQGLSDAGHQVAIFAPSHPKFSPEFVPGLHSCEVFLQRSLNGRIYPDTRVSLPSLSTFSQLKKFNPDIVHSFTPFTLGVMAIILARRLHVPLVFTHGTRFDDQEMLKSVGLFKSASLDRLHAGMGNLTRRFLDLHDAVVVSTHSIKDLTQEMHAKTSIHTIAIPVPVNRLQQSKESGLALRHALGIELALEYVGRLSAEKRVDDIIRLLALLAPENPKLKLVLIGGGPEQKKLFDLAHSLKVLSRIVWFGEQEYTDILDKGYYYLGDIFVTMSATETLGLSTIEAMACGRVVTGRPIPATTEILRDTGILLEDDDLITSAQKIQPLLVSAHKRAEFAKKSQRKAKDYAIPECTQQLVDFYQTLLN